MRIAIIDDNTTVLITTDVKLRKLGAIQLWDTVDKFKDADSFLEAFKEGGANDYGIIIVDHDLGRNQLKGYELISLVQKDGYKNRAVLFTADDSISMHLKMTFTGRVDYVIKSNGRDGDDHFEQLADLIEEARDANVV